MEINYIVPDVGNVLIVRECDFMKNGFVPSVTILIRKHTIKPPLIFIKGQKVHF